MTDPKLPRTIRRLPILFILLLAAGCPKAKHKPPVMPKAPKTVEKPAASRNYLGIRADKGPIDPTTGTSIGVTVKAALPGSPAEAAGLTPGDVILEFDDQPVLGPPALAKLMDQAKEGSPAKLKVRTAGKIRLLSVKIQKGGTKRILERSIDLALAYLVKRQADDGSFPHFHDGEPSPAVTSLVAWALAETGPPAGDARIALRAALALLRSRLTKTGELAVERDIAHLTYAMSCTLLALQRTGEKTDEALIQRLASALVRRQVDEEEGYDPNDWRYGAWPYYEAYESSHLRTDISTAAYVIQALERAKMPSSSPVWRRYGLWLDEAQNIGLRASKEADRTKEEEFRDGGFGFNPRDSKAGSQVVANDLIAYSSYGSATADGLRALIAVDGSSSGPRAVAALQWLVQHYSIERNPGFGEDDGPASWGQGIYFYYLHSLARAFRAAKLRSLRSAGGEFHAWPEEMIRELARRQRKDGSWRNPNRLMNEQDPVLATALALLALDAARDAIDDKAGITVTAAGRPPALRSEDLAAQPPSRDPQIRGLRVFRAMRCFSCHKDDYRDNAPQLPGVGDRFLAKFEGSEDRARAYLRKHIRNPKSFPGTRPWKGTEMPSFSPSVLPAPQLEDLVSFLLSRRGKRPVSNAVEPGRPRPPDPDVGRQIFQRLGCESCHEPMNGHGPDLMNVLQRYRKANAGSGKAARRALGQYIREPRKNAALGKTRRKGPPMPGYPSSRLSKRELGDLIAFLQSLRR